MTREHLEQQAAELQATADDLRELAINASPIVAIKVIRRLLRTVCRVVAELDDDTLTPTPPGGGRSD